MAKRKDQDEFLKAAQIRHGDRFDYSRSLYVDAKTKVDITCRIHNTEFHIIPRAHLRGLGGCPDCRYDYTSKAQIPSREDFISKASLVHGDRYTYPEVIFPKPGYVSAICSRHGLFTHRRDVHLAGGGCVKCQREYGGIKRRLTRDEAVQKFIQTHGNRYDYSRVCYVDYDTPVEIVCQEHQSFFQTPDAHIHGGGCHRCNCGQPSKGETELFTELSEYEPIRSDRTLIRPYEIDIWIPKFGLAIDYAGLYWHSSARRGKNYHRDKLISVQRTGNQLLTIFEDEWTSNRELVLRRIRHLCGSTPRGVGARKCMIRRIEPVQAKAFLKRNHLQGAGRGHVCYGAFYRESLIAVMQFGYPTRQSKHQWELHRFSSDGFTHPGIGSKLFQTFIKEHTPKSVVTFADLRWFQGQSYIKMGFHLDGVIPPDYSYYQNNRRFHKSNWRKSNIARKRPDLNEKTEREATAQLGLHRIYDCGKLRFVWSS